MKTKYNSNHTMKKLLPILLFFVTIANGQIVNIPDANFKAKLIALGIDTNSDGNIQNSEALTVTSLDVKLSSISDLTGISSFLNLTELSCGGNQLSSLDVTELTNLIKLECQANEFLTNLNVSPLINLEELEFTNCSITSIDISNLTNLKILKCGSNGLTSLDVSNSPNLEFMFLYNNQLTSIDLTGLNNLKFLNCSHNLFTNLNINFLTSLEELTYGNTNLNAVDISNLTNLSSLGFAIGSQLPPNLENYPNLSAISIIDTSITNLDLSYLVNLNAFYANGNAQLSYLNLKNGNQFNQMAFVNNTNLSFICVNETDIQTAIEANGIGNGLYQVNSYCSFTPGGSYNTITGTIHYDSSNNGCDIQDPTFSNIRVDMQQWGINNATVTNSNGNYTFFTTFADQGLSLNLENPSYFNVSPQNPTISFNETNFLTATQDFCISPNGSHMDLDVTIEPVSVARPGFDATYKLVYRNKGNMTASFNSGVRLDFNPNQMSFVSASEPVGTMGTDFIIFDYTNLIPFETRVISVTFHINSPTDSNPVVIGDILNLHSNVGLNIGDENPTDNDFYYNQTVVGSFDPNEVICLEGNNLSVTEIGKYLHYAVNFENTGNYQADNVVVKIIIDPSKYDINSFQLLNSSHSIYTRVKNNVIEFIFENINLAAASGNPPVGGHGDILFKIKSNSNLVNGDFVSKKADIFFDYNAPITTNDAITTYQLLSNPIEHFDNSIKVYPNPAKSVINIKSESIIEEIELYDVQGRILERHHDNSKNISLDISDRESGIYFIKIKGENGSKVEKLVKE